MTGQLDHLQTRLDRCRQAAAYAAQQATRTTEVRARQSFILLAEGWKGLAEDLERRLNGDARHN